MSMKRLAPGPRGSVVMGNLAEYKRNPVTMLLKLQQQYGDIARNRLGPFLTHALAHPDGIQHVLQDNHRNYVRGRFYDNFKMFFGDGLLTTDGEFWRRHRRVVQPLFHRKQVESHTAALGDAALALVERWLKRPAHEPFDAVEEMMRVSLRMLGLMLFNADISRHADDVGPAVRFGIAAMMPQGNLNDFVPRWMPTPFNRRIAHARRGIDAIVDAIVAEHRAGRCETSDVISLLLAARDPETGAPLTEREVHDEVMTVFLAGHETTGSGMAWGLYALAQHPDVLRRLRDELDAVLGGRAPDAADLERLPYLAQTVDEILRLYPPIWGFTRDLVDDDEIGGYHVPAGSSVFMSPYVTHRHPALWANPDAFDPENFGSHAPARHKYAYFPFGGGMRKCIGYQTALLQIRVLIAVVAQHVDLSAVPGHSLDTGATISLRPRDGIRLIAKRRSRERGGTGRAGADPGTPADRASVCPFSGAQAQAQAQAQASAPSPAANTAPPANAASPTPVRSAGPALAPDILAFLQRDPVTDEASPGADATPTHRFTWRPVEIEPLPDLPAAELSGKRIAIVNGLGRTVERVVATLTRACAKPSVFAPADGVDPATAASTFFVQSGPFDGIVDLGVETPFSLDVHDQWEAPLRRTVALLQACYGDWSQEASTSRLFYLALTWQDGLMGHGDDTLVQPLGGLWAGLAKTLPQELPNCNVRVLDIAPDETGRVDQLIMRELYRWGRFEVGHRSGRRHTLVAARDALPADAAPDWGADDVVLFSGGARGIGFLAACALAKRHRCTVIVTGRDALPVGDEPWLALDDAGFKRYGLEQLRQAAPGRSPKAIRDTLRQLERRRELKASLDAVAALGLPVHYRVCDVTDAHAVRTLCDAFGDRLRGVIHNAGIDQPVRLSRKSADEFIGTVRVKVLGFVNLYAAVRNRPRVGCFVNVGSLTGRWGGMTGETDYAAANEALARLGWWARRDAGARVVKTIAWPTWDGVGMITNLAVTRRYVTPMRIDEGVRHWLAELATPATPASCGSGEPMYMGAVGRALTPIQLRGFDAVDGLPNLGELATRRHHAGAPRRFRPFSCFSTRYRTSGAPYTQAFRFDGRAAVPASLLLEHARVVADWVAPPGSERACLHEAVDITIALDALAGALDSHGDLALDTDANGRTAGDGWHVTVRCASLAGRVLLDATFVYRSHPPGGMTVALPRETEDAPARDAARACWRDDLLPEARWSGRIAQAKAADPAALWGVQDDAARATCPQLWLPVNHLENVLRVLLGARTADGEPPRAWRIGRIVFGAAQAGDADMLLRYPDDRFAIADRAGASIAELYDARLAGATDAQAVAAPDL
ncbi:cytochrome P450 [Burkholderia territorii]|uniref:cytochrome P450 n=1 Tax=Burkholderia territorii TaxID=1503055 RepID=UPI00075DDD28|nr:cytochrome P450 [Burkholderia territorii]KWE25813.1 cytochrome [Burkholderia territorii]KWE39312.1 cytochrome [Burkholderia territorii]KWE52904.1 cytochrome [Burkholderia territorii]